MDLLKDITFTIYQFDLRFTASAKFRFSHARAVYELLCNALQVHPLTHGLIPYPAESGKIHFNSGDPYRFYLTAVGNRDAEIRKMISGLTIFENWEKECPVFRNKIELEKFSMLDKPDWQNEIEFIKNKRKLTLHFLTPLRIRRETKKGYFDHRYFNLDVFFERLYKYLAGLAQLSSERTETEEVTVPPLPRAALTDNKLLWLDIPGKPALGGVLGTLEIEGDFVAWLFPLILGQYLNCGKNTAFGLGRYVIEEAHPAAKNKFIPSASISQRVYDPENLLEAFREVKENGGMPGVDNQSLEDFTANLYENLKSISDSLKDHSYKGEPLLGLVAGNKESPRALAIPTVRDRIAQRALVRVLNDSIEQVLEDCSYAYRKGFSRFQARRALELAYREGYRYVLEADIDDFFDTVGWDILFAKLEALFPNENFVDWIKDWIRQTVIYEMYKITRSQGLPQGAVISPLLANLYLDEFDEGIRNQGFRLIRYADDFVICCKSHKKAEEALALVKQKLEALALELNEDKTKITHFDHGFRYLGFLFCRSVSVEVSKKDKDKGKEFSIEDWQKAIAPNSWLAALHNKGLLQIIHPDKRRYQLIGLHQPGTDSDKRMTIYLSNNAQKIQIKKWQLIVSEWDEENKTFKETHTAPVKQIKSVVAIGNRRLSVPAMIACAKNNIPVYFCRRDGELITATLPLAEGNLWKTALDQIRQNENDRFVLMFSKRIVQAKIHNCHAVLRRRLNDDTNEALQRLKTYKRSCENKKTIDSLRGVEGKAAADYFALFAVLIEDDWGFKGRIKHPAPDPVNAMLSFGYTLLYHHLTTALYAAGLNPMIGIYHIPSGQYFALASDLQEEFRFLADTLVLTMLNERMVTIDNFQPGKERILFKNDFKKRYITLFETKLSSQFTYNGDGQKYSYRAFFEKQAVQLKHYVKGNLPEYEPLVVR